MRDGAFKYFGADQGLPREFIITLQVARDGSLWVGTANGVAHIVGDTVSKVDLRGMNGAQDVFDFHEDADGTLWIASDRGLVRYRNGQLKVLGLQQGLADRHLVPGRRRWPGQPVADLEPRGDAGPPCRRGGRAVRQPAHGHRGSFRRGRWTGQQPVQWRFRTGGLARCTGPDLGRHGRWRCRGRPLEAGMLTDASCRRWSSSRCWPMTSQHRCNRRCACPREPASSNSTMQA